MTIAATDLRTNRDLYIYIGELARKHGEHSRSLESYLRAVHALVLDGGFGDGDALPLPAFASILARAFEHPVALDHEATRAATTAATGRRGWEARLAAQLEDLRGMAATGALADEYRYFGIDAPSGARWYNFDPCTYIECGAAGTFGDWAPEDDTGRIADPGPAATTVTGDSVFALPSIDWDQFADFLSAGAHYE